MNHDAPWWCSLMADAPPPALPRSITKGPKLGPRDESTSTSWREATNQHHDNVAARRFPSCARFTESRVVAVPISSPARHHPLGKIRPGKSPASLCRVSYGIQHAEHTHGGGLWFLHAGIAVPACPPKENAPGKCRCYQRGRAVMVLAWMVGLDEEDGTTTQLVRI